MRIEARFEIQPHVDADITRKIRAQQSRKSQPRRKHGPQNQNEGQERVVFVGIHIIDQNFRNVWPWDLQEHDHDAHEERLKDEPPIRPEHLDDLEYLTH